MSSKVAEVKDILKVGAKPLTFNGRSMKELEENPTCGLGLSAFEVCARPRKPTKVQLSRPVESAVLARLVDEKCLCMMCNVLMATPIIIKSCGHKFC